jgi:phage protein D/phage baseplate assembly protein gpV
VPAQQHTAKLRVDVDGRTIPEDLDNLLVSAFVDDSTSVPDMFQLAYRDPSRRVLEEAGIRIGSKVRIVVFTDDTPGGEPLFTGEVTSLEAEFDPGGTLTVVRGYDPSHRLCRGRVTESYRDVTYSDIAGRVARRVGLEVGQIDPHPTVHRHVSQGNVTDWQFLTGLAEEIGYEVGCFDGTFAFRRPRPASSGPGTGSLASEDEPLQLVLGTNLLRFRAVVTAAEQVKEVTVRGWDVSQKREVVGSAPPDTASAAVGVRPAELADRFGGPVYVGVDVPHGTQAEVDAAAKARAERIAGAFCELEGVARGNPKLRAGRAVSLGLVGEPFDGRYTLSTTRHVFDPKDGYVVWFTVSGRQERSLFGLVAGGTGNGMAAPAPIHGVVPAIVTDVNDPEKRCRVKVRFPWLSDGYSTDWVRTVQLSAGNRRGGMFLPEVNDEVLVAFEQGDIRRPYVIGGLYNGVDAPEVGEGIVDGGGQVSRRAFVSKKGHELSFADDAASNGIRLRTGSRSLEVRLDDGRTEITVTSNGTITIKGTSTVTVESSGQLALKAAAGITIDGGPSVEVKGGVVKIN